MEKVASTGWLNSILVLSLLSVTICLIIEALIDPLSMPLHVPVTWAVFVTVLSTWLGCLILRYTLKANAPIHLEFLNRWFCERLKDNFKIGDRKDVGDPKLHSKGNSSISKPKENEKERRDSGLASAEKVDLDKIVGDIDSKFIEVWYKQISNDRMFPVEAKHLLRKLVNRLNRRLVDMNKIGLVGGLADIFLLHLKEYRRALRRVEKGTAADVEEAYRCTHPGSRSTPALEHGLYRLITVLAREFLQWELTSSLPCKLLLSILARKLQLGVQTVSCPTWLFQELLTLISAAPLESNDATVTNNGVVSMALGDTIKSTTATVIPRPLPRPTPIVLTESKLEDETRNTQGRRSSLSLEGLAISHRGLWGDVGILQPELEQELEPELDEERLSPVYEEPTDFATTIARLRSLLQQKSTATTPLQVEEKSCAVYEGSQFPNLAIPWTEFYTAPDGSQQLLYCIQFDDVEQHGTDYFENTIATVRRQHSDFVQLHASLEEVPSLAGIMTEFTLPEGGRVEMENYLKMLCTRLSSESPPQLRHFLRPNSGAGKKADAVAPRLDRFLAKTVTGVFNTLKTVVPGFEMDTEEEIMPLPTLMPLSDIPWRFIEDVKSKSLASELQQLVAERIDYCSVDTAYEAVDSVEGSGDSELLAHWWETVNTPYDEELDEVDSCLILTRVTIDLLCEALAGAGSTNALLQEAVVRSTKLFLGYMIECTIRTAILQISNHLDNLTLVSNVQNENSEEPTELKDKLLQQLHANVPSDIKMILGDGETKESLKFLMDSLGNKKINQDLSLQLLDVLASQLLTSCRTSQQTFTR